MKARRGFVSNSSSSSFIITNTSRTKKTLLDFVVENPEIVEDFGEEYGYQNDGEHTQENMISDAENDNIDFAPGESKVCVFGDEDGTVMGRVYDYMLRYGGTSNNFKWKFHEHLR